MAAAASIQPEQLRLAELLAALSLVTDLGMGLPDEHAARTCLLATVLARRMGLSEREVADVYFTSLIKHVGCTAYAREQARFVGGDDNASLAMGAATDFDDPKQVLDVMMGLGRGQPALRRARLVAGAMARGKRWGRDSAKAFCEVGAQLARRMGLGPAVARGLGEFLERWDGKGDPRGLARDEIALTARFARLADQVMVLERLRGLPAAREAIRARSGGMLDPNIAAVFLEFAEELVYETATGDPVVAVVEAEPEPLHLVGPEGVDDVARAFGDAADMKSPFHRGHSTAVARLAAEAGERLRLSELEVVALRRAGYIHDLGRVSVPTGIWEKRGPLSAADWERVRLHPYHTERILARSTALAPIALLAAMHHERQDGSGYHRQASGGAISMSARVLAAADAYQAMTQDRAHRSALPVEAAAKVLDAEAARGRFDLDAVRAVLAAAGRELPRARREWPAGLTDREVEVLRLVAYGLTTRQIARRLSISPRTADHHIEHIYTKLGVSSRAAAGMYAMEHDLIGR